MIMKSMICQDRQWRLMCGAARLYFYSKNQSGEKRMPTEDKLQVLESELHSSMEQDNKKLMELSKAHTQKMIDRMISFSEKVKRMGLKPIFYFETKLNVRYENGK